MNSFIKLVVTVGYETCGFYDPRDAQNPLCKGDGQ